jgi:hypothetical protein
LVTEKSSFKLSLILLAMPHKPCKQIGVVTAAGPSTKENAYTRRLTVGLLDPEKNSLMGSQNVIDVDYAREHIGEKIM